MLNQLLFSFLIITISFPQTLSSKINKVLGNKFFDTCLVSIQVEDLTTNKTLFKKNENILLRPASNMKILTSAAGLIFLGESYEFTTNLYYDGFISNDTLNGNLYFEGGCDPDFTTNDFYYFINSLRAKNIRFVNGKILGDVSFKDSLYWGKGWMWDDDPSSDAQRLSALNLNDNCVTIVTSENKIELLPKTNFVELIFNDQDSDFSVSRDWLNGTNKILINGKSNYIDSIKVNIINPEKYFLTVFKEILDSNGISVAGETGLNKVNENCKLLESLKRKYSDVIINLNKNSDNLSAEMTLYALSEKYFGRPASAENGIKIIYSLIDSTGLQSKNYRLADGSGVSHYNVISSELIAKLLKYIYQKYPDKFKILYDSFPVAGVDGTLENRIKLTKAFNNVHAKTGTLTGVSCLSGYVTTRRNHLLAFSIMMQNFVGSSKRARDFQDKICEILSNH
ncbi:D-alanyl-D-alanine carboxypeptidase [Ignavibacterium album JCM 16511]|uniref:D-alanyl-D-alanine carboxypeptidase n=1 Tax=Ignavibacterium album (strain DSM 19864 / JCM 16511 / NBRC 101810 / Mat9-16) TaxID=945713 RepID=I0AIN9_IGNAJ|nr:D-alanyl-D-alanine carboxypeptidase/D-alanyl-D-alanine-endopeptidase [Ignavibacterium album]AFH48846.1 D-alanyl-D-alanine carboxypeptidase [Ignavibacterium album JCM 16511]